MTRFISLVIFLFILSFYTSPTLAQLLPPKAGNYSCFTTTYVAMAGGGNGGNPSVNGDVFGNNPIQSTPAFFGNIIFDGKGNYAFSNAQGKGRYIFNKATSKLSFTGDLGIMEVQNYNSQNNAFIITNKKIAFECALETQRNSSPINSKSNTGVLNEGLPGKLLTTTAHKYGSYFGKVFEFELSKGSYNIIFPDGVAAENLKGEILYFDKTSRIKITDKTGNTTIKQLSDKVNYNFDDYYPAISSSGEYVALTIPNKSKTGTLADLVANGVKLLVADRNGQGVGEFKGYTQAAWMSDGRIVVAGDGDTNKGLFIIDAKFKSIKKLFEGFEYAKMPAVSPDSKTIAFSNKGEIWTINIDGTNPVKAVFGNESNFPAWSPDGKYLAVNVLIGGATTKCLLYIVNLKLNKGFYVKDSNGNNVESWNRITWLP